MDVTPLDSSFGATVRGLTVTDLDEDQFQDLYDMWLRYSLLILPGQHLDNEKQIAFAKRFGALEPKLELYEFSNIKKDGSLRTGDEDDMKPNPRRRRLKRNPNTRRRRGEPKYQSATR